MYKQQVQIVISGSFMATAGNFVMQSINHMIIWFIVMFGVIMCDLAAGVRKSILMGEEIRITRAFRDTMLKMITYFSFVMMVVVISLSTGIEPISKWSVLLVCTLEGLSIIGNLLKPKGYDINLSAVITMLAKKIFNIDKEYSKGIIEKQEKDESHSKETTDPAE